MLPNGLLDQFANTFREWHYFIGGFSLGAILGWVGHAMLHALTHGPRI
jgi:hypothetical protein